MSKRILIAGFKHETNTFCGFPADMDAYRARALYTGAEVQAKIRGTQTEPAAFLDFCAAEGWEAVTPVYANATPSGPVSRAVFDFVAAEIGKALDGGPFDAVMLSLHGAMVCDHVDDGEGELLAFIRGRIGPHVPIAVTLDLHANVTDRMADLADIMIAYRTYPHVDQVAVATQAAGLIKRTLSGEIKPRTVVARGRMLDGADHGRTTTPGPMTEVLTSADKLMAEPGVLATSVCAGFPWVDIEEAGPTAIIVGDGASEPYIPMAEGLIDEIWQKRHRTTIETVSIEDAMAHVRNAGPRDKPIVLADFADNPGGGGYGDATNLLGAMIEADLQDAAFATVYDPTAAQTCWDNGLGAIVHLDLGGKIDPQYGAPINVRGTVAALTDGNLTLEGPMTAGLKISMGPTALLRVGGIDIVVTSGRFQAYDRMYFQHVRIDAAKKKILAVKSAHHFRAAFAPLASEILLVDGGGGLTSRNYKDLSYTKVRRPVFPLDLD